MHPCLVPWRKIRGLELKPSGVATQIGTHTRLLEALVSCPTISDQEMIAVVPEASENDRDTCFGGIGSPQMFFS